VSITFAFNSIKLKLNGVDRLLYFDRENSSMESYHDVHQKTIPKYVTMNGKAKGF
jgi:hypothetical protein